MEAALRLKVTDPTSYDALSPGLKTELAYYRAGRIAARQLGLDRLKAEAKALGIQVTPSSTDSDGGNS